MVINANSPPRDGSLWDQFILIIFNDRHAPFLVHHLDGTDPVTMWYRIDNPDVKKFEDFLLHDFPHRITKPTLGFS